MVANGQDERVQLARRIRVIRVERYGEGVGDLAVGLGIPAATWRNYEAGVTMPATLMLRFVLLTGVSPAWLLTGDGRRYAGGSRPGGQESPNGY